MTNKWDNKEIEILNKYGSEKLLHELMGLLPGRTKIAIKRKRENLGIVVSKKYLSKKGRYAHSFLNLNKLCKTNQLLVLNDIDNITMQVLLGSVLGDGGVRRTGSKNTRNFIFSEMHRKPQFDYTDWKAKKMSIFNAKTSRSEEKNYAQLWTASHPIFSMLRDKFYPSRSKCDKCFLPLEIISNLDFLGLMVWYLDDGYLGIPKDSNKNISPHITAKGWNLQELENFITYLNKKLDIFLYVKQYEHKGQIGLDKRIVINKENSTKLFPIWGRLAYDLDLPKCMYYKLNLHKGNNYE